MLCAKKMQKRNVGHAMITKLLTQMIRNALKLIEKEKGRRLVFLRHIVARTVANIGVSTGTVNKIITGKHLGAFLKGGNIIRERARHMPDCFALIISEILREPIVKQKNLSKPKHIHEALFARSFDGEFFDASL